MSGKNVNFVVREVIFGLLKSLQNFASFELIKLQNSEKKRTQKKIHHFSEIHNSKKNNNCVLLKNKVPLVTCLEQA